MSQNYIIDKLTLKDLQDGSKIIIPNFQRGIVWTKEHRKEFLSTIRAGDPFGVILVYKDADKYILVDGLQRLSTLKAYMTNPLEFIDEKDKFIDETKLEDVIKEHFKKDGLSCPNEDQLAKFKKIFKKKMLELIKKKGKPSGQSLWRELSVELGYSLNDFDITEKFLDFYDSFIKNLDLPEIIIHAIVYTGPKEQLPTVFNNLNTGSVTLTKYEIYASIWSQNKLLFTDNEIITKVLEKYMNLKNTSAFDVDTDENILKNEGLTLFEYCYAFSEILNDSDRKYKFLFPAEKKSTDPTGFDLLAIICGLPINKSQLLSDKKFLGGSSVIFLQDLKDAVVDCVKIVANSLYDWVHDIKGIHIKNDSLYQIYHMIASVFENKYELDLDNKTIKSKNSIESNTWINKFKKYAYKHYINDILSMFWSKNRQVSDLTRLLNDKDSISKYTFDINESTLTNSWLEFFEDRKGKDLTRNIDNTYKLILNYIYRLSILEDNNKAVYFKEENGYFDIEHIVPVNIFNNFIGKSFAISRLGNLCYLALKDNRAKRDKTIYQYSEDRPAFTFNIEFLEFIDYPPKEELSFINCNFDVFEKEYNKFLKEREDRIQRKLIKLLKSK